VQASNILLAYDNPRMLLPIGWALEDKGYNVIRVPSGEAAVEVLAKKNFDLILMDLDLHKTNGINVLKKAKELNPETMVILLCSKEDMMYSGDTLQIDADDYIFKPCSRAHLWKRAANCLETLKVKRSSTPSEPCAGAMDAGFLKVLKITLVEIQNSLLLMKEILTQINWGAYGRADDRMTIKLLELTKIVTGLNSTVAKLTKKVPQPKGDLGIEKKRLDWKNDVIDPILGNIPH
jgi:CheY-like chemotaxis protein